MHWILLYASRLAIVYVAYLIFKRHASICLTLPAHVPDFLFASRFVIVHRRAHDLAAALHLAVTELPSLPGDGVAPMMAGQLRCACRCLLVGDGSMCVWTPSASASRAA